MAKDLPARRSNARVARFVSRANLIDRGVDIGRLSCPFHMLALEAQRD
jgi:hypothetical protein